MIEKICEELGVRSLVPHDFEFNYRTNFDDFNYVDGEEGDYGIIKYYTYFGNQLIATEEVFPGDGGSEFKVTEMGRNIIIPLIQNMLENKFDNFIETIK